MEYRKIFGNILVFMCVALAAHAQSMMTDEQVLKYIQNAEAAGKSRTLIAKELVAKGVNRQQALRVKDLYKNASKTRSESTNPQVNGERTHTLTVLSDVEQHQDNLENISNDAALNAELKTKTDEIFGRSIFRNKRLNFAPSENLATPQNYRLGPGDEVIVDIFGVNQTTLRSIISPEGSINVDVLGPVYLNGMNVDEANKFLKKKLSAIYAGIESEGEKTDVKLTLGRIRSIQINILGDVTNPGTYNLSSFSTVFHALYVAGGINGPGSLREIVVNRNGQQIAVVDVYDFLMNGNRSGDIRLEEGDVILVPSYKTMVKVSGKVKRPMLFELKEGETLERLIDYAGGFAHGAYTENITIVRQNGKDYEVCSVKDADFKTFQMCNGDEVEIGELVSRFKNRISIKGAVYHAGVFQLDESVNTVKALIQKAEGLMPEAFTNRALLSREREDRSLEMLSVDVEGILNGTKPDIALRNNDELFIPSKYDLSDAGTLTITGEVANPTTVVYAENTTLEDLIIHAGGLLESASLARVDVIRRLKDPSSTKAVSEISRMYSFSIKDNYVVEGEVGFKLEPYDVVVVRKSPTYIVNKYVSVSGEVNFPGKYPITQREERLSDLIEKAGGATDYAYIKGARLVRQLTKEELERIRAVEEFNDSILGNQLYTRSTYSVAINLEKALENPQSVYDVVLREGDELVLPVYSNTVRVEGSVLSPNEITYEPGKSVKYYIQQAGGYADNARKRKVYMLTMNGYIKKAKGSTKVEPGSKIIVPEKTDRGTNFRDILAVATTASSIATMAATIANILK